MYSNYFQLNKEIPNIYIHVNDYTNIIINIPCLPTNESSMVRRRLSNNIWITIVNQEVWCKLTRKKNRDETQPGNSKTIFTSPAFFQLFGETFPPILFVTLKKQTRYAIGRKSRDYTHLWFWLVALLTSGCSCFFANVGLLGVPVMRGYGFLFKSNKII